LLTLGKYVLYFLLM